MSRKYLTVVLIACILAGCGKRTPPNPRNVNPGPVVNEDKHDKDGTKDGDKGPKPPVDPPLRDPIAIDDHKAVEKLLTVAGPTQQERFDAALQQALGLLADRKFNQGLDALRNAQAIQDSEQVRQQIDTVKALIDQQTAADSTAKDVQTVLTEGKADEAAKLGSDALQQFGGGDAADALGQLKRQADALATASLDDKDARRKHFLDQARAGLVDKNFRAAALAFEQAQAALADDPTVRKQEDEVRATLTRYDRQRARAAQLRRDPAALEEAIVALQDAQKAWSTTQVQLELDEYTFALQNRRDRVSVVDFEVRGDVGLPAAGRTLAEELLPALQPRFDLVERQQVANLLDDLKLETGTLADTVQGRQAVGRLAKVRYLVFGSVTPLGGGVSASARLVEVPTGLVVQTARVSAPTIDALVKRLPLLGQMLLLTDEQKTALEQRLAAQAAPVDPIASNATLPPVPAPVADAPGAPLVTYTTRPVDLGGLVLANLLEPPDPVAEVVINQQSRRRLLGLSLQLGDNLFRRGQYGQANRLYVLALNFCDDPVPVLTRLDRCRAFLPPSATVSVTPPRLVVFGFLVNSDAGLVVPAGLRDWAADNLAGQLAGSYEVVDRGEVAWYMARLGLSVRDVLTVPSARCALAQALNVRYFLCGAIVGTVGLDVTTYLIDTHNGSRIGTASLHVQDPQELKLRSSEIARQLDAGKDQAQLAEQGKKLEEVLDQLRTLQLAGNHEKAALEADKALQTYPGNVALLTLLLQSRLRYEQTALETFRKQEADKLQADLAATRQKQDALRLRAEKARLQAEQDAKDRTEAARKEDKDRRLKVAARLRAEGQHLLEKEDHAHAVECLRSAVALVPVVDAFQELARAEVKLNEVRQKKADDEQRQWENKQKTARATALDLIQTEKKKLADAAAARRQAQEERDQAAWKRLVDESQVRVKNKKYDEALVLLHSARLLRQSADVDDLVEGVRNEQELEKARQKSEQAAREAKRLQDEEKARQKAAAEKARLNQEEYRKKVRLAKQALADRKYKDAEGHFDAASKLFRTDEALNGLRDVRTQLAQIQAVEDAKARRVAAKEKVKKLLKDAAQALVDKEYETAVKKYTEAVELTPVTDKEYVDILAAKVRADRDLADFQARNRARLEREQARKLLDTGRAHLQANRYDEAVTALRESVRLNPRDPDAPKLLDQATIKQRDEQKRREQYRVQVAKGKELIGQRKYDDAIKLLTEAGTIAGADQTSKDLIEQAKKALAAERAAARVPDLVAKARKGITNRDLDEATKFLAEAQQTAPRDKDVLAALKSLETARKQQTEDYNLAMDAGRAAVKKFNYQGAANAYKEALRIKKNDKTAADAFEIADKKAKEYAQTLAAGQAALGAKKSSEAIKQFTAALALVPGDPAATKGLNDAKALVPADPDRPRKDAYAAAMKTGRDALALKKFDAAIKSAKDALALFPSDKDATALLKDAESGAAKKRETDYLDAVQAGRAAFNNRKYDDAVKFFTEALRNKPKDVVATDLLKQAEDAARKMLDFNKLMAQGRAATTAGKHADAVKAYTDALKLFPDHPEAKRALDDARKRVPVTPPANPQAEYAKQMQAGAVFDVQKKYTEAMTAYKEALRQIPNDARATAALKKANFNYCMAEGMKAAKAGKFPDAVKQYEEAVKLFPTSTEAKDALKRAKEGKP